MKLRPFELILVVVFGTLIFLALILLRTYTPSPAKKETNLGGGVSIWGVLPPETFNSLLKNIAETDSEFNKVTYRYVPTESFDNTFVNALADQTGPDLILLPHDKLVKHRSRLQPIPYSLFPIRDFRDRYIDGAEIFTQSDGIYGFPIAVDPLIMYWHRDVFSTNGLLSAPSTWEDLVGEIVPTLTTRDYNRIIQKSAVAMGEYQNIKNAFSIISLLLLQGGSALVTEGNSQYRIRLNESLNSNSKAPFEGALAFFTNFSNISNTLYSWNRSLPLDRDRFVSEDLAIYFGYGSEGHEIAAKNPNLNFDASEVPQGASATVKRTYGLYYSLVMTKASVNKAGATAVMQVLGSSETAKQLADAYNLVPALRSALSSGSNDVYGRISYASAPYSRGWLNPDLVKLNSVLTEILSDINANRRDIYSATSDAITRIQQSY